MKRNLTEEKVLKKLGIPDFRHLSKEKIITFASMLPNMDPEVAKKALEQFPNFASTSLSVMQDFKGTLAQALTDNSEDTKACYDMYNRVMDSLQQMLDKDELSFEEQQYILEQMKEVADNVGKKKTENQEFLLKAIGIAGAVAVGIVAVLGSALGANIGAKSNTEDIV